MGTQRILVDTRGVISIDGAVTHTFWPAKAHDAPVLVGDRPWERFGVSSANVIRDGDRYRMWYLAWPEVPPAGNSSFVAYAESEDGIQWEKPDLSGSNIVNLARHQASVVHDPDDPDPTRRYKAVGMIQSGRVAQERGLQFQKSGFYLATSPDGIVWEEADRTTPVIETHEDVGFFMRDTPRNRYIGYVKRSVPYDLLDRRSVAITASQDFQTWTPPRLTLVPDGLDDRMARERGCNHAEFYGLAMDAYPGFLIGFLWVYWPTLPLRAGTRYGWFGQMDVQLIYSFDGAYWFRTPRREPILTWGERGRFDESRVTIGCRPVHVGDEIRLYYSGSAREHAFHHGHDCRDRTDIDWQGREYWQVFSIGFASLKRDRYASLSACGVASFTVRHGHRNGTRLLLNARALHGCVKAEILDRAGRSIQGFSRDDAIPFEGDALDAEVRWRNRTFADLPGNEELSIRFHLDNADVFAYYTE